MDEEEDDNREPEEDFQLPLPDPNPPPFQFRLRTLFLLTTSVALILAVGQFFGWKNLLWIVPVFLNPYTLGCYLGEHAERINRQHQRDMQRLLDRLRKM
jgi:hypothetical protein